MTWSQPHDMVRKDMLFEDLMSNVDESADKSDSFGKDIIVSNEPDEDEVEHDPFEIHPDDDIPFSRLLFDLMVNMFKGLIIAMQIQTCNY
jgi:hypothetical protein